MNPDEALQGDVDLDAMLEAIPPSWVFREQKEILGNAAAWFAQETGSVPKASSNS